ncbi:MAG: AI-2E family transporter, partial [Verrucomicrobiota bacterium]
MAFPPPTEKQARVIWFSLTGLAVAALIVLGGLVVFGFGWLANELASVIFPLATAAVLAYLLDPLVDLLERRKIPRTRAIL